MSTEDVASFKSTVRSALDEAPDAEVINWQSPDGKRRGKIYPKFSFESGGATCRRTLFRLVLDNRPPERYRFDLCRREAGWEVVEAPAPLRGKDREDATAFLSQALTLQESGQPITWVGAESGHSATLVPLDDPPDGDQGCRTAAISLTDGKGNSISGRYRFCIADDGEWTYEPASAVAENGSSS